MHAIFRWFFLIGYSVLILTLLMDEGRMRHQSFRVPSGSAGKHILLYLSDTTRLDSLGEREDLPSVTPHLDSLARESVVFDRAYANSPWTPPSHASLFTGLLPIDHGLLSNLWLPEEVLTLAERLSQEGYYTIGFSQNPFVGPQTNLSQGFLRFYEITRYCGYWNSDVEQFLVRWIQELGARPSRWTVSNSLQISQRVLDVLQRHGKRQSLFIFINVMDPHTPYRLSEEGRQRASRFLSEEEIQGLDGFHEGRSEAKRYMLGEDGLSERQLKGLRAIYDGEVARVDRAVGVLIDGLRKIDQWDHTLFVFTSDHGEEFGEHHLLGHGMCAYDTLLRVPLLIRCPWLEGWTGPARYEGLVQLADLPATLCRAVGLDFPEHDPYVGRNLANRMNPSLSRTLYGQYDRLIQMNDMNGLDPGNDPFHEFDDRIVWQIQEREKRILGDKKSPQLYDLLKDPWERDNLAEERSPLLQEIGSSRFGSWLLEPSPSTVRRINRNTLKRLKALGYLGGEEK